MTRPVTDIKARALTRRDSPRVPQLADLDESQRKAVFKESVRGRLVKEMDRQIDALSFDFGELVDKFLATRKSTHTVRRYRNAIRTWVAWCTEHGIEYPLLAECQDADLFAASLAAPASVNSAISAVSSLYSTLLKWGKITRTPFMKIARRSESASEHNIPTAKEVKAILEVIR